MNISVFSFEFFLVNGEVFFSVKFFFFCGYRDRVFFINMVGLVDVLRSFSLVEFMSLVYVFVFCCCK